MLFRSIRPVRPSDLESILEISKQTWGGFDYLPNVIGEWLKNSDSHTYGLEADKKLVALANLRVIEGGKTGWMEGLRVHTDYRGKGFASLLTEYVIDKGKKQKVDRLRYTTGSDNEASLKLASKHGFSQILEMGVFWHPNLKVESPSIFYPSARKQDPPKVYTLLQENPSLIPNNTLVYDWKALDISLQSLTTIAKTHRLYAALKKGRIDSLSLAYPRPHRKSRIWITTIYAKEPVSFFAQLDHNMTEAQKEGCKAMMCTYRTELEKNLLDAKIVSNRRWRTHLVLLERLLRSGDATRSSKKCIRLASTQRKPRRPRK